MNSFLSPLIHRYFIPDNHHMLQRRYDLDWLRIIVFMLLIFYHIGMVYTENWGYHIKSSYQSAFLANIMLVVEPWRMAVLWFISGVAIRYVLVKVSIWRYISLRSLRLLLPLLFGILVVIPPQLFVEMTSNGDLNMSYQQFYLAFFNTDSTLFDKYQAGIWPHIDVNHLWYLRSLWQFSIALLFLLPVLNSTWLTQIFQDLIERSTILTLLILLIPIFLVQLTTQGEITREILGFTFLIYGYLLGTNNRLWQGLAKKSTLLLISCLVCLFMMLVYYHLVVLDPDQKGHDTLQVFALFNYSVVKILGLFTLLTFAYKYLNHQCKYLSTLNDSVYPMYILHQSIIVVGAYLLAPYHLGGLYEPLLLVLLTVSGCILGTEIIRRSVFLRPLFGMKLSKNYSVTLTFIGYGAAFVLVVPLAIEILF
jgi:hypothetical protein